MLIHYGWVAEQVRNYLVHCPFFIKGAANSLLLSFVHASFKNVPFVKVFIAHGVHFDRL